MPFKVPEVQEFPVGDMFTPIVMKKNSLKVKFTESLQYTPSWKKSNRMALLFHEKSSAKSVKLPFMETRTLNRAALTNVSQNLSDARFCDSSAPRIPEKQKENIELNPTVSLDATNHVPIKSEIIAETVTGFNETVSLEIALTRRGLANHKKNEFVIWPYDLTFKDDKKLIYNVTDDDASITFKEPRPKRPETLELAPVESNSNKESPTGDEAPSLPSRIAELFKEQWLSPFSVLYIARILSVFYKVGVVPCSKTDVPPASSLSLFYELNPSIQNAFKKSLKRRSHEFQKIDSPISFSLLHRLSGKNALQTSLPVRSILIGADGDYMSVAPNCLKSWRKLFLEPFSGPRDVAYVVVAPDSDLVLENTKQFFKELSMTYEVWFTQER